MDALKFLKTIDRMCETYDKHEKCPLYGFCYLDETDYEKKISLVEQWDREHPVVTWGSYLRDLYNQDYTVKTDFWNWLMTTPLPEQHYGNDN